MTQILEHLALLDSMITTTEEHLSKLRQQRKRLILEVLKSDDRVEEISDSEEVVWETPKKACTKPVVSLPEHFLRPQKFTKK
jgi:hypothetical protein